MVKFKQIDETPRTFVLVFRTGDELTSGLLQFANESGIALIKL